jgi:hypothetical protein
VLVAITPPNTTGRALEKLSAVNMLVYPKESFDPCNPVHSDDYNGDPPASLRHG